MIATNAFKQAVSGTYTNSDTVIELNSISDTVGNADYLPDGGFNLILYDGLFGNPADANNAGKYEILECSSVNYATNEITVVREVENTTAVTIDASSWQVVYGATVEFFAQFEDADATILKQADVVDTLVSTSVIAPLSANQGKELQDNKEPADATILKQADVVDTLVSTSAIAPLSANQGKQLQDNKQATLVSGTNIKTINGDSVLGSGDLEVGGGKVLQVVFASHSTQVTTSSSAYSDTGLTGSITPESATSEIYIYITNPIQVTVEGDCNIVRGSTDIFTGTRARDADFSYVMNTRDLPATTSSTTYKMQHRATSGTFTSQVADRTSTMILIEVEA